MRVLKNIFRLAFHLAIFCLVACTSDPVCVDLDVEIVVTDTRTDRNEGSARVKANFGGVYNYKWDTGRTTSRIEDLGPGNYCATVTSSEFPECETVLCGDVKSIDAIGSQSLDDGQTKILFLGNSHTFYNDLPTTVKGILENTNLDQPIIIKSSASGGWRLENHAEDLETTNVIRSSNWDYVVLQENAGVASLSQIAAADNIYPHAEKLYGQISDNNPDTKVILYLTHAYKDGIEDCDTEPTVCTYELMQNEIRRNYLYINELIKSEVAPAGIIWKMIFAVEGSIDLFDGDKIHPSPEGSQVSAATIAAVISKELLEANHIDYSIIGFNESKLVVDIINKALLSGEPYWRTF